MQAWLRLFPRAWRDRYGADFAADFRADPRRAGKWLDAARTAAGLRWGQFAASGPGPALALGFAITTVIGSDLALGVGMDEEIDADLLHHWWGAPIAGLVSASVALAAVAVTALVSRTRRSQL